MTRNERNALEAAQAEVGGLGALLRCVRVASENEQPRAIIDNALAACEEWADAIADRMETIPGLNDTTDGGVS